MTAIGLAPVAARVVIAVWRISWNARILPSTPAAASADENSPWYQFASG
jgi:hypothetical protein